MIDAHVHFWDPSRGDYGWLTSASPLCRPFLLQDYAPEMRRAGIDGALLIQAAPTTAETDYLLGLARASKGAIAGVVGWLDLQASDAPRRIAERAGDRLFVGVRPMLHDLPDRQWILQRNVGPALAAIAAHGLVFDAVVHTDQLDNIDALAARHPDLTIVLDHAGKPQFGSDMPSWHARITRLAARANIACKLSGLATELPPDATPAMLDDCIDTLLDLFGIDRLIWGSDWPIVTLATSISGWRERCADRIVRFSPDGCSAVFGENARRIYRLSDKSPVSSQRN